MDCISSHVCQSGPFGQLDEMTDSREHNVLSLADQGLITLGFHTCSMEKHHCDPSSA